MILENMPYSWDKRLYDLVDPWEFDATLKFHYIGYMGHGHFLLSNNNEVVIFGSDLDKVLLKMVYGVVRGKWLTVKRGNSIGLMPIEIYD